MNSRMNILSSRCSNVISCGTLESLVHVGWITGISGFAGLGLGWGFPVDLEVDAPADVVISFVFAAAEIAALARLRS